MERESISKTLDILQSLRTETDSKFEHLLKNLKIEI